MLSVEQINRFREAYISEANGRFRKLFELYGVDGIESLLKNEVDGQRTQQLASIISPLNEAILNYISKNFDEWDFNGNSDSDSAWLGIPLEHKLSISDSCGWTGHWYSKKTPWHLLMKLKFEKNQVSKLCMFLINLSECSEYSQWPSLPSPTSSFATLKIHVLDQEKIVPIFGSLKKCRKWCSPLFEEIK